MLAAVLPPLARTHPCAPTCAQGVAAGRGVGPWAIQSYADYARQKQAAQLELQVGRPAVHSHELRLSQTYACSAIRDGSGDC